MRLENKVAIITGSSTGIGFAVAKEFVKNGAKVVLCGMTIESTIEAKDKILAEYPEAELLACKVDISKTNEVVELFNNTIQQFGKLDVLVNNAGIAPYKPLENMTDEDFINVIDVNLVGTFRCTREAVKYMKENGGSIINTSSFVSLYGASTQSAYTASKAAINGLTKSNAKELGKYNIRVNSIAPGVVMTDMVKETCDTETIQRLNMMTPLHRGAETKDLVGLYVHLASDESLFTTGTIINIDGGLVM